MKKDISPTDQDGHSRGHIKQVKRKAEQLCLIIMCAIFVQIMAAIIVSLFQLIDGACTAIPSTMLYSLERGSEGMSMSLEVATWARKLPQKCSICW